MNFPVFIRPLNINIIASLNEVGICMLQVLDSADIENGCCAEVPQHVEHQASKSHASLDIDMGVSRYHFNGLRLVT